MNMFILFLSIGFMELVMGPSGASAKKEKGKKTTKIPRGKEDKEKMKYQFQGVEIISRVAFDWDTILDT